MATIYCASASATNLPVGSDSNDGLSISAPKLTLAAAFSAAGNGGIIYIDGLFDNATYTDNTNRNGITVDSYVAYSGIIRAGIGGARVFHIPSTGFGITLKKIVLDANNQQTYCITCDSGIAVTTFTIDGTKLLNPVTAFINAGIATSMTMLGNWIAQSNGAGVTSGVLSANATAGTFNCGFGTFSMSGITGTFLGFSGLPTVTGNSLIWHDIAYNVTGSSGATFSGGDVKGYPSVDIYNLSFNVAGISTVRAWWTKNHATIPCTSCKVHGCTGSLGGTSGYLILIGDDVITTANTISGALVYGNNLSGANHGYMFGFISDARSWGNRGADLVIGCLIKGDSTTAGNMHTGNILERINTAASTSLYIKGASGAGNVMANNTIIVSVGYVPDSILQVAADGANNSANGQFYNNCIYSDVTVTKFVNVLTSQSATFSNNSYYSTVALPANCFTYQASSYSTLVAWQAVEASAVALLPAFLGYSSDYRLNTGSALWRAGAYIAGTRDFRGRKFSVPPSIGAYEPSGGDPVQIARTARA